MADIIQRSNDLPERLELDEVDRLLVASGFYRADPPSYRTGVFALGGDGLDCLADVWMNEDQQERLIEELQERLTVRSGGWDTMYSGDWSRAWTHDDRPFRLWNTDGLAWERRGDELVSHSPTWSVPTDEVDFVAAFVSPNWVKRGVRLRCLDETLVTVTEEKDTDPVEMPTYDSMLLMADTGWAVSLGRALAADLDVEFVDEIP